jgi:5-methyltetrahydropteroyltriglutamate--homocysteine methyltransferase
VAWSRYTGAGALANDIRHLQAAVAEHGAVEAFMPSISPTNVEDWQSNEYYSSDEEFLFAIADAMHEEYAPSSTPACCCKSMILGS